MNDDEIVFDNIDISRIDISALRPPTQEDCTHDELKGQCCLHCGEFVGDIMTDRAHDRMDMER